MAWVSPQRLLGRWQPEMFRAEYLELDRQIESWDIVARLGDLVSIVHNSEPTTDAIWRVSASSGVTRSFPAPEPSDSFSSRKTVLPDRAILVTRTWFDEPKALYWDAEIYRGKGVADSHLFVLESKTGDAIGWLLKALASEHGKLQIERCSIGSTFVSISSSDLLDIKIQLPSEQERDRITHVVQDAEQQNVIALRSRSLSKSVVLTGRTHEERLEEFEELLVRDFEISPDDIYFIEPATRNRESDLFAVRRIGGERPSAVSCLVPQDIPLASELWKQWFWNSDRRLSHRVFNSFAIDSPLPTHLLLHLAPDLPSTISKEVESRLLPGFPTFRDAIIASRNEEFGPDDSFWAETWCEIQQNFASVVAPQGVGVRDAEKGTHRMDSSVVFDLQKELFDWSRRTYRPVLAVKIWHDEEIVGTYLLVGEDQIYQHESAFSRLDDLGVELSEILQPPSERTDDVLRRESLRRLNDIMHRLNGPLLNANDALGDIRQFLAEQPEIAAMLVPNEGQARSMAAMNRDSSAVRYQLASRFETLAAAVDQIRGLSTQVKTLARIEERLNLTEFSLEDLASDLEKYNSAIRPIFSYQARARPETRVQADRDLVTVALGRVLDNSIREIQERSVDSPTIAVTFSIDSHKLQIQVEDNALPEDEHLPPKVFDERVSKYFRSNKGSGFGLMSVRRVFERHRSQVSLTENFNSEGDRRPGVTFTATLQLQTTGGADNAK